MSDSLIRLSLSVKGLQGLEGVHHERDFAFIVGDERYSCPSFVAEFLSPRVNSLRSQDITVDEFSIETSDENHYFGILLSIGFGHDVSLSRNEPELSFVRSVCGELWNAELFEQTLRDGEGEIEKSELKARLEFLSGVDGRYDSDFSILASHFYEFSASDFDQSSPAVLESILRDPRLVVGNEDSVFEVVHRRASSDLSYFGLLEYVRFEFVSAECMKRAIEFISDSFEGFTFGMWLSLRTRLTLSVTPPLREHRFVWPPAIDSTIISSIPDIFSVFRDKIFCLLYRGSRDGFEPSAFHGRCNGHSNTVTLILSTNDCIFGGFTPIAWSSRNSYASDPSLNSFLFTIKNLHNLPPQIFKQQRADKAIYDHETCGPAFGSHRDLVICDQKTSSDGTFSHLGSGYTNDTGIGGSQVLTGARKFSLKEIAVFEVI